MQSATAKTINQVSNSTSGKSYKRNSSSVDHDQGNFSLDLWKKAFKDACERICPVRAGGHECGCLPLLSKLVHVVKFGRNTHFFLYEADKLELQCMSLAKLYFHCILGRGYYLPNWGLAPYNVLHIFCVMIYGSLRWKYNASLFHD